MFFNEKSKVNMPLLPITKILYHPFKKLFREFLTKQSIFSTIQKAKNPPFTYTQNHCKSITTLKIPNKQNYIKMHFT